MFSERHTVSLLKRGNSNGKSKLQIQELLEDMLKEDQDYIKIDVQEVSSDIRKETILWMMREAHNLRLPRSAFYNALDRYDLMCSRETSEDLELHKLVGATALRVEETTNWGFEVVDRRQFLEDYFAIASEEVDEDFAEEVVEADFAEEEVEEDFSEVEEDFAEVEEDFTEVEEDFTEVEEDFAEVEQSLLEREDEIIFGENADFYLDQLIDLLGDSTASIEAIKTDLEMREVLDLCILDKRYRIHSPLALAAGVFFWYARGAQAPWLHFLSSMCPDISEVIVWVASLAKIVNGRQIAGRRRGSERFLF